MKTTPLVSINSPSGEGGESDDVVDSVSDYAALFPLILLQAKAVSFFLLPSRPRLLRSCFH